MPETENRTSGFAKTLFDLYLAVSRHDEPAIAEAPQRLAEVRARIAGVGTQAEQAMYDRLFNLIALYVPALDEVLALPQGAPSGPSRAPNASAALEALGAMAPRVGTRPGRRLAVSGIGRSGTTLIYQQIAKSLKLEGRRVNYRYEPYLWNIQTPATTGNAFDMAQMHHYGLHVHTASPLILHGSQPLHDGFIDHLFNQPWDDDPSKDPDAYLTKVIRGSGRLRSYLARYPDLKIVACLRNPLDTINSSLGMFSFFGEEFHSDDRPRFRAELEALGIDTAGLPDGRNCIEWYGAWWQRFTEETLSVAAEFPDQVFRFCYEAFQVDNKGMLEALQDFVGVKNMGMFMGLNQPAGPSIKSTSLTAHDLDKLSAQTRYYHDAVLVPALGAEGARGRSDKLVTRYLTGKFSFPIAGSDLSRRCPIQLRDMILKERVSPFQALMRVDHTPIQLDALIEQYGGGAIATRQPVDDAEALRKGKRFGVVITCHNNAKTIVDAVLSCLNQTLPFDEIVVVDDKSRDGSVALLRELERLYSSVRVLELGANLGPSAARDMGIRSLTTDFFTQLDGDDLFWPTKNATEVAAIAGDENAVAFSDILLVMPEKNFVQPTVAYHGEGKDAVFGKLLARLPQIPRDMTLSRARYFAAGGYNKTAHLYEDWDFKLRLAALGGDWRRAEGVAGTVYNRLSPGLSGVDPGLHARALALFFLAALGKGSIPRKAVLETYDAALRPFKTRHIAVKARELLVAALSEGVFDPAPLSEWATSRQTHVSDNAAITGQLVAMIKAKSAKPKGSKSQKSKAAT